MQLHRPQGDINIEICLSFFSICRQVIHYLLESGAFDQGSMFQSDQNVKPPVFNKSEAEAEEVTPRHRHVPYNFSPSFVPK